jgi:hypothetical protein
MIAGAWGACDLNHSPLIRHWLDLVAAHVHVVKDPNIIGASVGAMLPGEQVFEPFS